MAINNEAVSIAVEALYRSDISAAIDTCKSDRGDLFDEDRTKLELDFILTRTPQALIDCPEHILEPIRIATALMILWGVSSIRQFISVEGEYDYRIPSEAVAHMLSNHATYLLRLTQMSEAGFTKVQILNADLPDECAVCRKISRRRFNITAVPELPLTDCTCPDYCKCVLIAVA